MDSPTQPEAAAFSGLIDLASERLGGQAVLANDEFFAPKENLLKPSRGVFLPDEYTDRVHRGEKVPIEEYVERYPQIADVLRQMLPSLRLPDQDHDRAVPSA